MERRKFTREFKLEAVRLIKERGVSYAQASHDLSVHQSQLRSWVKALAADPLHRTRINAKTVGNLADTFTSALALVQCGQDSFLKLGGYPRPAKSFALVLGPSKASADLFGDHRPQLRRVPKQIVNPDS